MKTITAKITALLVLIVTTVSWTPNIYAADSYLMVCRTGGNMQVRLWPLPNEHTNIFITFKKSKFRYDFANPQLEPGECAWKDRPINDQEHSQLVHNSNLLIRSAFYTSGAGKTLINVRSTDGNNTGPETQRLSRFLGTVMNENFFTVRVINGRHPFAFEITSFE